MISILEKYLTLLKDNGFHNLRIYINEVNDIGRGTAYGIEGAIKSVHYIDGEWTIKDEPVCVNFFTIESLLDKYIKYLEYGKNGYTHIMINIDEVAQFGDGIVELNNGTPSGCLFLHERGIWI